MNIKRLNTVLTTTLLALGLALAGSVSFAGEAKTNASAHKFELAKQYYGQCTNTDSAEFDSIRPQLNAFTDMEVMAQTMADPAYYTRWMNALANPTFYQPVTALADPAWYTPRMNWMMNPQSMQPMFNMMNMGNYFAPVSTANSTTVAPAN